MIINNHDLKQTNSRSFLGFRVFLPREAVWSKRKHTGLPCGHGGIKAREDIIFDINPGLFFVDPGA